MELRDMILRRRSCRNYTKTPVGEELLAKITAFAEKLTPLYPEIETAYRIVPAEQVRFYLPWKAPQLIAVFSRQEEGWQENLGFLWQQMDLYLQSLGLGCCWMGLGKLRHLPEDIAERGMRFGILLAFGHTEDGLRPEGYVFKRKTMEQISDRPDPDLEPARVAPSSTNSQPWYFTHEEDSVHVFCHKGGLLKHKMLGDMNRIDMGIALAHLYVSDPERFQFLREKPGKLPEGYSYIGTVKKREKV
jgi:nitroreductase